MKKIVSALCAFVMLCSMGMTALAAPAASEVVDLGDGYTLVVTTDVSSTLTRASTVGGTKRGTVYVSGKSIGQVVLDANFSYDGSSATCTWAGASGNGLNGGSYQSGSATRSGNKATGNWVFSYNGTKKTFTLSMTCSGKGVIS